MVCGQSTAEIATASNRFGLEIGAEIDRLLWRLQAILSVSHSELTAIVFAPTPDVAVVNGAG